MSLIICLQFYVSFVMSSYLCLFFYVSNFMSSILCFLLYVYLFYSLAVCVFRLVKQTAPVLIVQKSIFYVNLSRGLFSCISADLSAFPANQAALSYFLCQLLSQLSPSLLYGLWQRDSAATVCCLCKPYIGEANGFLPVFM